MGTYRSALGKQVDMSALAAKNQRVRAVGNMSVNARGDTIDSQGRIIQPVTEKVTNNYSKTVGNRSAHATKTQVQRPKIQEDLTDYEKELTEEFMEDDKEVETLKKTNETK